MEVKAAEIIALAKAVPSKVVDELTGITGKIKDTLEAPVGEAYPALQNIIDAAAMVPAEVVGFILTIPAKIKAALSGGFDLSEVFPGTPSTGDSGINAIPLLSNIVDIAALVSIKALGFIDTMIVNIKNKLAEVAPDLPFFSHIMTFASSIVQRSIALISVMQTAIKDLLKGQFDSSAFFTGITTFAKGVFDDVIEVFTSITWCAILAALFTAGSLSDFPFIGKRCFEWNRPRYRGRLSDSC